MFLILPLAIELELNSEKINNNMKWAVIIVALLACKSISSSQDIVPEESDVVCWDYNRKLSWDDFMGNPDTLETIVGKATAVTVAKISCVSFIDQGMPNFVVENCFMKTSSWVNHQNEASLQHEQLHFDIAELYARKIRKGIYELRNQGLREMAAYSSLINKLLQERNLRDEAYDYETAHSLLAEKQSEWNKKIAKELEELKKYSSSADNCECGNTLDK